ncbi:MAG: alpha/beta hydrolase [Balneolaceae bacterium]|nr:alpha/beta hydrolase [Balneolaceae bacterium]
MIRSDEQIVLPDNKTLHMIQWNTQQPEPAGVLMIAHGLSEHSERYSHVARFFTEHGFLVYGYDHRGHGRTDPDHHGFIDSNAPSHFDLLARDAGHVFSILNQRHPILPFFILGHSMGSFIIQRMMQIVPGVSDSLPDGIIYSGSNGKPPISIYGGKLLSRWIMNRKGPAWRSQLIDNLVFGRFNKPFEPAKTRYDWLSRDRAMVQLYVDDPSCGFVPSVQFYHHFFSGLIRLHKHQPFAGMSTGIPTLIIGGDNDPVSNMGKGLHKLTRLLRRSNAGKVDLKIYPGARHEVLNETNRDEVMNDLYSWMQSLL